jgi:quercetin dioxygenase-like cupin family protein
VPFINIDEYEPFEIVPGARTRTPYGENIMFSYLELDEGSAIPLHQHPHEQAGMLLKGKMELTIDGECRLCAAGDMFIIPSETPHSARPIDGPALVLDVFSPVREDYAEQQDENGKLDRSGRV